MRALVRLCDHDEWAWKRSAFKPETLKTLRKVNFG